MNLSKLSEPFEASDIEWRVSRAGTKQGGGIYCSVLAYITARAIQHRLDDVVGPESWQVEEPRIIQVTEKVSAFAVGISIRINDEWITKWDVSEPTQVEPAKGGFSGGMKRAGAQWGIGRYLYHLDEVLADVETDRQGRGWNYAKLKDGTVYYWKTPGLPAWALPKDEESHGITEPELAALKKSWREKFAPTSKNPGELREGFTRFVTSVVGEFPSADHSCWTRDAMEKCQKRITETKEPGGVSSDVPFE